MAQFPPKTPLNSLIEDQCNTALDLLSGQNFTGAATIRTIFQNLRAARESQDWPALRDAAQNLRDQLQAAPDSPLRRRIQQHAAEILRHILETINP